MANVETGDIFSNSNIEKKWSLSGGFSIGSKSSRSTIWSGLSNGSKWRVWSSVSLPSSIIQGDVEGIINYLSLQSNFLYWPIPPFFLFINIYILVHWITIDDNPGLPLLIHYAGQEVAEKSPLGPPSATEQPFFLFGPL